VSAGRGDVSQIAENAGTGGGRMRAANVRTGLILASIALAFFLGILLKYWLAR